MQGGGEITGAACLWQQGAKIHFRQAVRLTMLAVVDTPVMLERLAAAVMCPHTCQ